MLVADEEPSLVEIPPEIQDCVAFLGFDPTGNGDSHSLEVFGTCFFVMRPSLTVADGGHIYLVTAKHVIADAAHKGHHVIFVRVNMTANNAQWFGTKVAEWVIHPSDSLVDVAVFPFPRRILEQADQKIFPLTAVAMQDDLRQHGVGVGEELFFPGLFWRHYGTEKNLPIVRTGTIAGMPVEKLRVKHGLIDAYLVEARSIGGLSGSPVFVRMDSRKVADEFTKKVRVGTSGPLFGLLGLIRGHYEDEIAEDMPIGERKSESVNMGIGIVVPVEKIIETILHPELVEKFNEVERHIAEEIAPTDG